MAVNLQSQYQTAADAAAKAAGIPTNIFSSVIQNESSWNPTAYGSAGEIGLGQIKQGTASQYGFGSANLWDAQTNLGVSSGILSKLFAQFGNWRDALAAYNQGSGNVAAGYGYADKVLAAAGPDMSGSILPPGAPGTVATSPSVLSDPVGYLTSKFSSYGAGLAWGALGVLLMALGVYVTVMNKKQGA